MKKKLVGVLPKNSDPVKTDSYTPPKRRKKVEVEEADDGTFSIRCYGGDSSGDPWDGKLKTAASLEDAYAKLGEHFGKKPAKKA